MSATSITRRHVLLLCAATLALLLPFLNRAYNIDEPLFLWLGEHLQREPWDFYGFDVNWYGWPQPMHRVTQNPPLTGYWIAGWAALVGWSEPALHATFLLPALAVVLGTYFLARRLCAHPNAAALLALVSPVFLISATTVMCDVSMLALYVWALWAWIEGTERDRAWLFVLAGVLATLAGLTKYFGASVVPLCLAWSLVGRRPPRLAWLALLIPVLGLALYEWRTRALYGHGLLSGAADYAGKIGGEGALQRVGVGLVFAGGCFASVLLFAPLLWSRTLLVVGIAVVASVGFLTGGADGFGVVKFTTSNDPVPASLHPQALLATLAGLGLLGLAAADLVRRRDAAGWLLVLWLAGTFVFAGFVNWTNNGRSILPLAPPAAILLVRALEARPKPPRALALGLAFAASLALTVIVAWADARWSNTVRSESRALTSQHAPGRTLWFQGHWGFQYYMQKHGARALDMYQGEMAQGDRMVLPLNNTNIKALPPETLRLLEVRRQPDPSWVRTMSTPMRAGFYAATLGAMPYAFGRAPPDEYLVIEFTRPAAFKSTLDDAESVR